MRILLRHKIFVVCTLGVMLVMINLGFWQIRRYHYKEQLIKTYQRQVRWQPLPWAVFLQAEKKQYRRINVEGHFVNGKNILLDHRWHGDRVGYEVLTPFKVSDEKKLLLVNRGWVPASSSRSELPPIEPVFGRQLLEGYITIPTRLGFVLGKNIEEKQGWPRRIQKINIKDIEHLTHQVFFPYVLRLSPEVPNGFVREWQLVMVQPRRHLGYAVQWFAMALALIIVAIIFLRYQNRKDKTRVS